NGFIMQKILIITISLFVLVINNYAQDFNGWKLNGQIQLRSELDGRDFSNKTYPLTFASLRTRLGVDKTFDEKIQLFVQFQDSRVFGEESNTLTAIDNIDLHQGYVKLIKLFGWDWNIQAGRFEVAYGTERFFGAVGWHYVGRSFDGVRFSLSPENWKLDLFALTIKESNSYIANATPVTYPNPSEVNRQYIVYGFYKNFYLNEMNNFDLLGYYEANHQRTAGGAKIADMFTIAASHFGKYGNFKTTFEGAYQFGRYIESRDISAYLISLLVNYKAEVVDLGIGADILSGTSPSASYKNSSFEATFGTNHKFYGYMDYFISIPQNTNFLGLHDFYSMINYSPENSDWNFDAKVHHFMSNKNSAADQNTFGQEIDLTVKYNIIKGTSISWGGSLFFPGELMKTFFSPGEDPAFWSYVMITANL
ncbi:MAG TPA: alginate export family protein, partial [Ignavibacteriaceae bacterium]